MQNHYATFGLQWSQNEGIICAIFHWQYYIVYKAIFPSTLPDIRLCSYAPPFSLFVSPNIYIFTRFCDMQQSCCKGSLNDVHYSLSYNVTTSLLTILPLLRALPHVFIQIDYRFQQSSGFCDSEPLQYGL